MEYDRPIPTDLDIFIKKMDTYYYVYWCTENELINKDFFYLFPLITFLNLITLMF